jgi:tRNA(Ile)-lysidine synthase
LAVEAAPVSESEADRLFGPLTRFDLIIAAVSGGPDSLALMHLLAAWMQRHGRPASRVAVATVDHALRPQSRAEAEFVAEQAASLGLVHTILSWEGEKPATGLAAAARAARYEMLGRHAQDHAVRAFGQAASAAVVTGHTQDDQAETFMMRLGRGSGVEGLAAMAAERPLQAGTERQVALLRPFLDVSKVRLVATLQARGLVWIEDPSNVRLDQERPRTRALLTRLEHDGLSKPAIARSAQRLRRAQEALGFADTHFVRGVSLRVDREIYGELDAGAFRRGPRLLRERLLQRLIQRFGGTTPPPRLSEIEDLAGRLEASGEVRTTLGGCFVSLGIRSLRVWREAGRAEPAQLLLRDRERKLWDDRFWVSASGVSSQQAVEVRCLGTQGVAGLAADTRPKAAPTRALWALPGFYLDGRLISVPTLSYQLQDKVSCMALPSWRQEP